MVDFLDTVAQELFPEVGLVNNAEAKADCSVARSSQKRVQRKSRAWFSPEIISFFAAVLDFSLVLAAAATASIGYSSVSDQALTDPSHYVLTAVLAATLTVGVFERLGGYRLNRLSRLDWQLTAISMTWGGAVSILLLLAFLIKTSETYSRGWALVWIISVPILLLVGRCLFCIAIARSAQVSYWFVRNLVIVGAGEEGQRLIASLQRGNDKSVVIRGVFDDRSSRIPDLVCGFAVRGTTDDLLRFARSTPVDEVVIALPLHAEQRLKALCGKLKAVAIDIRLSIQPLAETFRGCRLGYVGEVPALNIVDRPLKNWCAMVKLLEDKVLCSLALLLASPLMALIAILIKLDSRGPVFFLQDRFGFNNEVIKIIKFRTMAVDRGDPSGAARTVRDDPRVTRVGRILRWLSFDELPQLINVLRGDMSLVGPRPHAVAMKAGDCLYHEAVSEYLHRHRVKPGITGWAQVNGLRGEVDTLAKANARVACDLYYIEHWSFWLELRILIKTVGILAFSENAY